MLFIDSTVWVDYFNGRINPQTDYLDSTLTSVPILVGDLILAEVLQGFRSDNDFEQARRALSKFETVNMVNPDLAILSARNYRTLRKKGITVRKTIDSLIATYCIENNHQLLHNDSDFDPYEQHLGLQVVHPGRDITIRS
jgi:predicted nucleic acid-binding protein